MRARSASGRLFCFGASIAFSNLVSEPATISGAVLNIGETR